MQVHMPLVALNPLQQDQDAAQQSKSARCGPREAQGTRRLKHRPLLPAALPKVQPKGLENFGSLRWGMNQGPTQAKSTYNSFDSFAWLNYKIIYPKDP